MEIKEWDKKQKLGIKSVAILYTVTKVSEGREREILQKLSPK